jgi:hypothetical protein
VAAVDVVAIQLSERVNNGNIPLELGSGYRHEQLVGWLREAGITADELGFAFNKIIAALLDSATLITGDKVRPSDALRASMDIMAEWEIRRLKQKNLDAQNRLEARNRARDAARAALFPRK